MRAFGVFRRDTREAQHGGDIFGFGDGPAVLGSAGADAIGVGIAAEPGGRDHFADDGLLGQNRQLLRAGFEIRSPRTPLGRLRKGLPKQNAEPLGNHWFYPLIALEAAGYNTADSEKASKNGGPKRSIEKRTSGATVDK